MIETKQARERVVLVGIQLAQGEDMQASLDELEQVIPKNAAQAVYQQFRGEAQASPAKKEEGPCA